MPPRLPDSVDEIARAMGQRLQEAYDELAQLQAVIADMAASPQARRAVARVREYQEAVESFRAALELEAAQFAQRQLPALYAQGASDALPLRAFQWTQYHRDAAQTLAADAYTDLLERSQEAGRVGERFVREVRQVARSRVGRMELTGRTARQAGKQVADDLLARGITGVTYRDGSVHRVGSYAEMVARTKSAVAYNAGTLNRGRELGVRYVEVFDGADCGWATHRSGDKANGTFRTTDEAAAQPVSHPRCRRSFGPRPDLADAAAAKEARPSVSPAQQADQTASERRQTQVARSAVAARQHRQAARAGRFSA